MPEKQVRRASVSALCKIGIRIQASHKLQAEEKGRSQNPPKNAVSGRKMCHPDNIAKCGAEAARVRQGVHVRAVDANLSGSSA